MEYVGGGTGPSQKQVARWREHAARRKERVARRKELMPRRKIARVAQGGQERVARRKRVCGKADRARGKAERA
eukprot:15260719-Alexandrium_andersonii.AAC.1